MIATVTKSSISEKPLFIHIQPFPLGIINLEEIGIFILASYSLVTESVKAVSPDANVVLIVQVPAAPEEVLQLI